MSVEVSSNYINLLTLKVEVRYKGEEDAERSSLDNVGVHLLVLN
jgi:hypothetical protein